MKTIITIEFETKDFCQFYKLNPGGFGSTRYARNAQGEHIDVTVETEKAIHESFKNYFALFAQDKVEEYIYDDVELIDDNVIPEASDLFPLIAEKVTFKVTAPKD